ncbi:pseudouridine synthase [Comamonas odontotermitis]|uniref:pseudouridine synthase n=1 Tax=Comamonas odontotermitis TaxID=379895 RepID=UPI001CC418C0|nr:pseudouridine synthase [Comamonas odontotermitis]UBB15720.1 pseudouridine synthase [Comamonas odontotermitis]
MMSENGDLNSQPGEEGMSAEPVKPKRRAPRKPAVAEARAENAAEPSAQLGVADMPEGDGSQVAPERQAPADQVSGDGATRVRRDGEQRVSRYPARARRFRERDGQPRTEAGGMQAEGRADAAHPAAPARNVDATHEAGYAFEDVVAGALEAAEASDANLPPKRVLQPHVETPKLHKLLAQAGMGSRLEMERLILEGRISVNNEPAHVGQRIQYSDKIRVNGKLINFRIDPPPARVLAYHKPVGEVVTHDDPQNRPTVFRKLPRLMHGKWQSIGRLDLNTEGLLLFTSSGELANSLMHPRFGLEREYAVRVLGALTAEEKQQLLAGVNLEDGMASFGSIDDGGGEGANQWYRVTISEGRNREVRRMFEAVGHAVSRLIRIRYGAMVLPRGLKRGNWVELDQRDIQALTAAAGAPVRQPRGNAQDSRGRGRNDNRPQQNGPRPSTGPAKNTRGGGLRRAPEKRSSQPDPMKTSLGYIGHDSLMRQRKNGGFKRGGRS